MSGHQGRLSRPSHAHHDGGDSHLQVTMMNRIWYGARRCRSCLLHHQQREPGLKAHGDCLYDVGEVRSQSHSTSQSSIWSRQGRRLSRFQTNTVSDSQGIRRMVSRTPQSCPFVCG